MTTLRNFASAIALALAAAPAAVLAQVQHFGDRTPSAQEIERALAQPMEPEPGVKTRGLAVGAAAKATQQPAAPPPPPPSISLQIRFDFDSDRIQPHSTAALDNLARALQSESLRAKAFDVIGHTDGVGGFGYNMSLSQRRANAVRSYLMSQGVDPRRLRTIGKGPTELLNKDRPEAAENRRVEIAVGG
jgi:outer membrane protein OmpA-like peptidoglycan-associated protein